MRQGKRHITYDSTNQLVSAANAQTYALSVTYGDWGKIQEYGLQQTDLANNLTTSVVRTYNYGSLNEGQTTFAPNNISYADGTNVNEQYGINGSLQRRETTYPDAQPSEELYRFGADGNLRMYSYDRLFYSLYGYNGGTTRTYKYSFDLNPNWVNGRLEAVNFNPHTAMFYPNAYINFNNNGYYTKHYYNGMERIASRLGDQNLSINVSDPDLQDRKDRQDSLIRKNVTEITGYQFLPVGEEQNPDDPKPVFELPVIGISNLQPSSDGIYFYHSNHLGSTCYVTDENRSVVQGFLYAPFGDITNEYNNSFGNGVIPKYSFNAKELDEETGMYYYEARYYAPPVFISRDPLFEKYPTFSPYAYCANNPIKFIDPDGRELSTHTDESGKVIAVFDDGDNGVYMHGLNADGSSVTEYQITKRHEKKGTSAGGTYMGESLHSLSFVEQGYYNKTGQIRPMSGMIIDFGSDELTTMANSIMDQNPSLYQYQKKAGLTGDWDIKNHIKHGSMLYGKYASPRDAGNFVAGMVAASKGPLMENIAQLGYGAYNLAGNNKFKAVLIILGVAGTCAGSPPDGLRLLEHVMNGEDFLSQRCIDLGKEYQRKKK